MKWKQNCCDSHIKNSTKILFFVFVFFFFINFYMFCCCFGGTSVTAVRGHGEVDDARVCVGRHGKAGAAEVVARLVGQLVAEAAGLAHAARVDLHVPRPLRRDNDADGDAGRQQAEAVEGGSALLRAPARGLQRSRRGWGVLPMLGRLKERLAAVINRHLHIHLHIRVQNAHRVRLDATKQNKKKQNKKKKRDL